MSALPAPQRLALRTLATIVSPSTYLAGGVGIAALLQHRASLDLDLFVPSDDPTTWIPKLERLPNTTITSKAEGTVHLEIDGVPVSLLHYAYPMLEPSQVLEDFPIPVAAPIDLLCMKLSAITGRGARRDFWDLHALLGLHGMPSLAVALAAFRRKYTATDVGHVVKSLVYFADAESEPLPHGMTEDLWASIKADLIARVRDL